VVAIPGLDAALDPIPLEDVLVRVFDHAGFQRNQRVRNLEGRGRQHRLARAIPVAGDHDIILDLVADERADGILIGEVFGEVLADLAALGRDIGQAARRQDRGGSKQTERMAAIDHGGIRRLRAIIA